MKRNSTRSSRRYLAALRKHLEQSPRASLQPALGLGGPIAAIGLETLKVARFHKDKGALSTLPPSGGSDRIHLLLPRE